MPGALSTTRFQQVTEEISEATASRSGQACCSATLSLYSRAHGTRHGSKEVRAYRTVDATFSYFCEMLYATLLSASVLAVSQQRRWTWQTPVLLQVAFPARSPMEPPVARSWDVTTATLAFARLFSQNVYVQPPESQRLTVRQAGSRDVIRRRFGSPFNTSE